MLQNYPLNNQFHKTFGIGLNTSLIFQKKIGLNIKKSLLKLKTKHFNVFVLLKNNLELEKKLKSKQKLLNQFLLKIRTTNSIRKNFKIVSKNKKNVKVKVKKK